MFQSQVPAPVAFVPGVPPGKPTVETLSNQARHPAKSRPPYIPLIKKYENNAGIFPRRTAAAFSQ
jgi:hypothetical protein